MPYNPTLWRYLKISDIGWFHLRLKLSRFTDNGSENDWASSQEGGLRDFGPKQ